MNKIDWNKPLICEQNGARVVVDQGPDNDGDYCCKPVDGGTWPNGFTTSRWFTADGCYHGGGHEWTIANTELPALAAALSAARAAGHTDEAIAAAIAALPEPVDPLLEMAREAAARWLDGNKWSGPAEQIRAGLIDDGGFVEFALIALRMAVEQGWKPQ